jgi:hypothetical protein
MAEDFSLQSTVVSSSSSGAVHLNPGRSQDSAPHIMSRLCIRQDYGKLAGARHSRLARRLKALVETSHTLLRD